MSRWFNSRPRNDPKTALSLTCEWQKWFGSKKLIHSEKVQVLTHIQLDAKELQDVWFWLWEFHLTKWTIRIFMCELSEKSTVLIHESRNPMFKTINPWRINGTGTVYYLHLLGGGFIFFDFHPYLGKRSNLPSIFQMGWFNHQLVYRKINRS